jgi:spore coat protein A
MGITRLNVYAGLAGFYILTDDHEQQLKAAHKLPADEYDIGLAIQDRMFTAMVNYFILLTSKNRGRFHQA